MMLRANSRFAIRLLRQRGYSNQLIPQVGDVVEVRYLYAFPDSGVLFQPVCLGVRSDITAAECGTRQLKFKPSDTDEDA